MRYFQFFIVAIAAAMLASSNAYTAILAEKPPGLDLVNRCDESGQVKGEYLKLPATSEAVHGASDCLTGTQLPIEILNSAYELRLFAFDLGECGIFGRFNRYRADLMPAKGVVVDKALRTKIESFVPPVVWVKSSSVRFEPRHALVWSDQRGNIIATANACFACGSIEFNFAGHTGNIQFDADMASLKKLIISVGAPIDLAQACASPAHPAWKLEIDALCELKALEAKTRLLASPELRKRWDESRHPKCVGLPGTIRF